MKKALLAALCFILASLVLVHGTFALPDINEVFQVVAELLEKGLPEQGGAGTAVHVSLIADQTPQNIYPGGEVSRSFYVKNQGTGDVYFRLVYAIQYDEESWPNLNIRFTWEDEFKEHDWKDITIGSTPYKMKVFTYTEALPAAAESPEICLSIAMDSGMTSEQLSRYRSDFLQTQVLAVDPLPFAQKGYISAEQALDMALPLDTLNPF